MTFADTVHSGGVPSTGLCAANCASGFGPGFLEYLARTYPSEPVQPEPVQRKVRTQTAPAERPRKEQPVTSRTVTRQCAQCGQTFTQYAVATRPRKYCSDACAGRAHLEQSRRSAYR